MSSRAGAVIGSVPGEQQGGGQRPTSGGGHRNLRIAGDLALAALAAQLDHRLVGEAEAVQAPGADLTAEGVQRQFAADRDPLAALDEAAALADLAEAQRFQP